MEYRVTNVPVLVFTNGFPSKILFLYLSSNCFEMNVSATPFKSLY